MRPLRAYNAILVLTGNDIGPKSIYLLIMDIIMLITGALFNANIFGTISSIYSSINRKQVLFQEKLDMANTSMQNMKLPQDIQDVIRDYMMRT